MEASAPEQDPSPVELSAHLVSKLAHLDSKNRHDRLDQNRDRNNLKIARKLQEIMRENTGSAGVAKSKTMNLGPGLGVGQGFIRPATQIVLGFGVPRV